MYKNLLAASFFCLCACAFAGLDEAQSAFKKGDYAGAIKEYTTLANAGDINAQVILGTLYGKGEVVPRNDKLSAEWFNKAAAQGNVNAAYQLGKLYEESKNLQDYKQAARWYLHAAQKGLTPAQTRLGNLYSEGLGVPQSLNEALLWYGKAGLQGDANAQYALGVMYYQGRGLAKNPQLARGWLSKAAAQGNADAQFLLGDIYNNGQGIDKDIALAHALYNLAIGNNVSFKENATVQRDLVAKQLTPAQLNASNALITELQKPNNFSSALKNHQENSGQLFRFFPKK